MSNMTIPLRIGSKIFNVDSDLGYEIVNTLGQLNVANIKLEKFKILAEKVDRIMTRFGSDPDEIEMDGDDWEADVWREIKEAMNE